MATEVIINKIVITAEAVFDYEESLGLGKLDRRLVKAEIEDYITYMNNSGRLLYENYFRCKYLDENSGQILMLFVYRRQRFGLMQMWEIVGISKAEEWTEEAEDDGSIRAWVETKITDLPYEDDWVVRVRTQKVINYTEKIIYENVLTEVRNEFDVERDKADAEKILLLHSYYFKRKGRCRFK